jgi:maltose/moltooligosaccharide transporter
VPDNVIFSFYVGAAVLLGCVLWTIFTTKEYPPEAYTSEEDENANETPRALFTAIFHDFKAMPKTMMQLGFVQFFSWFALFAMWVFMAPAVAVHIYGTDIHDSSSETFNNAANWVGFIFGIYNGVAALYAFALPAIAKRIGRKKTHAFSLTVGGIALISVYFISNPHLLLVPMLGIGMAWGSILAMPYAILAGSIPAKKMGVYMGIFNFFITLPQILNAITGGTLVKRVFNDQAIYAIVMAGILLFVAAVSVLFVEDKE